MYDSITYMQYDNKLKLLSNNKSLKIILHFGIPKTATSTIQYNLHNNRDLLSQRGYCYPQSNYNPPKHQWIVEDLMNNNILSFIDNLEMSLAQIKPDTHTMILSTEGLFNHWYDYTKESKFFLKSLCKYFDIKILLVLREQVSFVKSYYKQILKNPQITSIDCYGKDISIKQLLEDSWFSKHLDYFTFLEDCSEIFGKDNIIVFTYNKHIVDTIMGYFNLKIEKIKNKNISLNTLSCSMLRTINKYNLSAEDKQNILTHIENIDKITSTYNQDEIMHKDDIDYVENLCLKSNQKLKDYYNITL